MEAPYYQENTQEIIVESKMLIWSILYLISQWYFGLFWPVQEKQQIWYWPVLAGLGVIGLKII